jgi:hypothetical protein
MRKMGIGLAAVVLAALSPAAAMAQDFVTCDGYDDPRTKSDGMTTSSLLWGLARANADIRQTRKGQLDANGVAACDRALADPKLLPAYQLRRAHLLQAKALHQIASNATAQALATLDQSDATGAGLDGTGFRDSIGLGNRAVRAWALIDLGRKAEATKEIEAIEAARPYAPSMLSLANKLRLRLDSGLTAHLALLKQRAVRDPAALLTYFILALENDKLDAVAAVGDGLVLDIPRNHGGWTVQGDADLQYELIAGRAEFAGAYSYALAATGKPERAAAAIARARQDLTEAMVPPPPPEPGRTLSKATVRDFQQRTEQGTKGGEALDLWSRAIEIRRQAAGQTPDQLLTAVKTLPRGRLPINADLLRQLKPAKPDEARMIGEVIARIDADEDRRRVAALNLDLIALRNALPRPETAAMQPRFKHAGDGYFLSDNGFSRRKLEDPNSWTVRFTHDLASKATVEELALLSAATLARREGFDGLLVQSRRTLERTTHVTSYYSGSSDVPSGNEAQLNVLLVKGGALPEEFSDAGWRVLSADAIISDLSGRYPGTPPVKAR